jgi:DNA repair protein RecN (Recombination protein N)
LVEKKDNSSTVKEVAEESRVNEIARMISGDKITKEALEFAKRMIDENN